jgi:YegS/Rv2252/BmrU family lipid kinase
LYTSKPSHVEVILNDSSGKNDRKEDRQIIEDVFKSGGIEARISLAKSGDEITQLAKRAAGSDAEIIVAGGGDGTISAVAAHLVGTNKTLGVLPLGTFNHFAKDLQIPLTLEDSLQNIIEGNIIQVDVGEVNGHVFINNSGLGFYPAIVKAREREQKKFGHGKFTAFIKAMFRVLSRNLFLHIRLSAEDKEIDTRTSFVFVGNNEYEVESFNFGGRKCLDAGHLSLYMSRKTGRWALIEVALHALTGKLKEADDFVYICTDEIFIETRRKKLHVAMDGEVFTLKSPLKYIVRPKALRVIAPVNKDDE